jgi:hypothetical protein
MLELMSDGLILAGQQGTPLHGEAMKRQANQQEQAEQSAHGINP